MQVSVALFCLTTISLSIVGTTSGREIVCPKEPFMCYDETRFYRCLKNDRGFVTVKGYLQSCPSGLVCNDGNEFECEEDVSKEFLVEFARFGGKEGRKRIIDD